MLNKFEYIKPKTETELRELLQKYHTNAKLLAGGTDLLVGIRAGLIQPKVLIDIKSIDTYDELNYDIEKGLIISPAVTCNRLLEYEPIQKHFPILYQAIHTIGSYQIRNRATVIGNISTSSPAADSASALLVLNAKIIIGTQEGERELPLKEFFKGVKKNALESGEWIKRIIISSNFANKKGVYLKSSRIKGHDLAICSVALLKTDDKIRIAIGSCNITPVLLPEFSLDTPLEKILEITQENIRPIDDIRASSEYRRNMVNVYIKRGLMSE